MVSYITYPLLNIGLVGSIYMTMAISIERYLGVCHPQITEREKARLYILPVLIFTIIFNIPKFINYTVNGEGVIQHLEAWSKTKAYRTVYYCWVSIIFLSIIPMVSILYLNGAIIVHIFNLEKLIIILFWQKQRLLTLWCSWLT